jgi:DNA modification methylase
LPVFTEVRRIVGPRGVLWLNCGDKYAASGYGWGKMADRRAGWTVSPALSLKTPPPGYKRKDLCLAPLELARALQCDGWTLRQTVIWSKGAAVEPPVRDRPSTSHEYLFLLAAGPDARVHTPVESWWHRSVWDIPADHSIEHPATMPTELVRRCLVTSTAPGDIVLDPFSGLGTVGLVADRYDRGALLIDIQPAFAEAALSRLAADAPLFWEAAPMP